jgi:hypothetical protein
LRFWRQLLSFAFNPISLTVKDRTLSGISIALAVAAVIYTAWLHRHADALAQDAVRKREAELAAHWAPTVRKMCEEMLGTNALAADPRTLEDLSRPLTLMLDQLGELPASSNHQESTP